MPKYISGQSDDQVLPEADYPFKIVSARLKQSKTGSEMIELILEAGENGNSVRVLDYLVFNGKPFNSGRIDQLRKAVGETILPGEEIDVSPGDLLDKTGRVHLVIENWNASDRNKVGSYLEPLDDLPGLESNPEPKPKAKKVVQANNAF